MEKLDLAFDDEADAIRWRDAIIEQVCNISLQERTHCKRKLPCASSLHFVTVLMHHLLKTSADPCT